VALLAELPSTQRARSSFSVRLSALVSNGRACPRAIEPCASEALISLIRLNWKSGIGRRHQSTMGSHSCMNKLS